MLNILYPGHRSSIYTAAEACFTKLNTGGTTTTITADAPNGVLGGMVAGLTSDYAVSPGTVDAMPAGLFLNNASGNAFENSPAVAANKVTVVRGLASVEVDVFETRNAADDADLTYDIGDKLYSSANALLSNEAAASGIVIGVVTKLPTVSSPSLGLDMRI